MKLSGLGLVLMAASLVSAPAQVTVEVTQEQEQFLPGESLPVAVRITNRSGQPLRLGAEEDWLSFGIETRDGQVAPKLADVPVLGEFVLESGKVATKRLDLAPYFSINTPDRYGIVATVRIRVWGYDKVSAPKYFTIIEGAKLWEQEVGVPGSITNGAPDVRKYMLQQANYIKGQLRLYVRVTDPYGRTFRVYPVGSMVSFSRPEPQVDQQSNLHLLYQNGATTYGYTVFNPDGDLLVRQSYDYVNTRPKLKADMDGKISVIGGARRPSSSDVPPETDEPPKNPALTQTVPPPVEPAQPPKK
jgi:hypothetical protein